MNSSYSAKVVNIFNKKVVNIDNYMVDITLVKNIDHKCSKIDYQQIRYKYEICK